MEIAVVGPVDSVALIREVSKEYKNKVEITTLTYTKPSEVSELIAGLADSPDAWLFSGLVPYYYAVDSQLTTKPLFYIPYRLKLVSSCCRLLVWTNWILTVLVLIC